MENTNNIKILSGMKPVFLENINNSELLRRFDKKFWLHMDQLYDIFKDIKDDYDVLEINGERIQSYHTFYYDTPENEFYLAHHNERLNRIKIRKRSYVDSEISFLEIKKKNNKGITDKFRMILKEMNPELSEDERSFIRQFSCCNPDRLEVRSENTFKRITLVNKLMGERCTIDYNMEFRSGLKHIKLNSLVIVELKQNSVNLRSDFALALKQNKIYQKGFSKYSIGRALLEKHLKKNRFKSRLIQIKKNYLHDAINQKEGKPHKLLIAAK